MVKFELKKIIKTKIFISSLILIIIYMMASSVLGILLKEKTIYSNNSEVNLRGYEVIDFEKNKKTILLNNKILNEFEREYINIDNKQESEKEKFASDNIDIIQRYKMVYGESDDGNINKEFISKKKKMNFYDDRISYGYNNKISSNSSTGYINYDMNSKKRKNLNKYSRKLDKPFIITYVEGWSSMFKEEYFLNVIILVIIIINIFNYINNDKISGLEEIMMSSQCRASYKKYYYKVSIIYSIIMYLFVKLLNLLIKYFSYGLSGGNYNIQVMKDYFMSPHNITVISSFGMINIFGILSIIMTINILFTVNKYFENYKKGFLICCIIFIIASLIKVDVTNVNVINNFKLFITFNLLNPEIVLNYLNIISFNKILIPYIYILILLYSIINFFIIYIKLRNKNIEGRRSDKNDIL